MNIWERQPSETQAAYAAFRHYIELPPGRRSLDAAYHAWYVVVKGRERDGKVRANGTWQRWSSQHEWVARAAAWDAHLAALEREKAEALVIENAEMWERRRGEIREREFALSEKLIDKGNEMLAVALEKSDWKMSDIPKFLETASKLARLASQLETDRQLMQTPLDAQLEAALMRAYADEDEDDDGGAG